MNGQIELHCHNSLSIYLAGTKEVHSEDWRENRHTFHKHQSDKLWCPAAQHTHVQKKKTNISKSFALCLKYSLLADIM